MMKKQIIRCFNKSAKTYDTAATVQRKIASHLAQRLPKLSSPRILEIGCGTGLFSQYLLEQFPASKMTLSDISPGMIETCKEKFKDFSLSFSCMDGENLNVADSYHLITSSMTFQWFDQWKESFENIIKKLVPQGQFIFSMLGQESLKEWHDLIGKKSLSFPSVLEIKTQFPQIKIEVQTIKESYQSIRAFLHSLKQLGAVAVTDHYEMLNLSKLKSLLKKSDSIDITYEVIYGYYHHE